MSKQANPTLIGIFVAGAIGLIVAGILIISGGKLLLTDKTNYVLYFKGSVKGLYIGSPVSFRWPMRLSLISGSQYCQRSPSPT